jgi:Schlafen, AlbA_2
MISYKVPEEQWTEKMVKDLPSEDDRFEFKENIDIEKITKEICAFANSFGGTLFLGVKDKNSGITGVDSLKGNKPTTLWLEQIIPTKLEFRFGSFRVREVKLASSTQKKIGLDKAVISIDVFDSELTPYQVVQTRIYYRRENSSSKEAPHSYLAYLWSRNSSDKTQVVQYWITDFLTPLISFTQRVSYEVQNLKFWGNYKTPGDTSFYILEFINLENWSELLGKLSANQFLRTYSKLKLQIIEFSRALKTFDDFINNTIENILDNECIKEAIREKFKVYLSNQNPSPPYDNSKSPIQMLSTLVGVQELNALSNNQIALEYYTSHFLVYTLFDFELKFSTWKDESFKNFCAHITDSLSKYKEFIDKKNKLKELQENIISTSKVLLDEADTLREELCLRHNTTY